MRGFISVLGYFALVAIIVGLGWNDPLRYRFMSPQDIAEAEKILHPSVPVASGSGTTPVQQTGNPHLELPGGGIGTPAPR